jgi:hypothetical protein
VGLVGLVGLALFAALFVGARLLPRTAPAARPGSSALVALPLALVTSVAALNYVANPFGLFRPDFFEPIVLHSRADKMRLYAGQETAPDVVVFGSSPAFTLAPSCIEQRTRQRAFNASLHGGTARDFLAFTRYMVGRGRPPRLAIVQLRVEQFRPDTGVGFEPGDPLTAYAADDPAVLGTAGAAARTLLTLEQTEASLRLLAVELRGRPRPRYVFDPDGLGHFTPNSLQTVDDYLAEAAKPHHFRFRQLSGYHLDQLDRFLTLCRENQVRVIVYVPPYHPRLAALWERETRLPELKAQLLGFLARQASRGGVTVHDLSDPAAFGGTERMFLDALHPDAEANCRMVEVMLADNRGQGSAR